MAHNPLSEEVYLRRTKPVKPDIRAEYFRDQTKIIHSYPFRRLKHKAQVFYAPDNDHICTRIEHVLHVATIAATICRGSPPMSTAAPDCSAPQSAPPAARFAAPTDLQRTCVFVCATVTGGPTA